MGNNIDLKQSVNSREKGEKTYLYPKWRELCPKIPVFLIVPALYVIIGVVTHIWHPTWLMFLFIPIHLQMCFAFYAKSFKSFLLRLPVLFAVLYEFLAVGLFFGWWKIAWIGFLLIPVYYWCVAMFVKKG